MTTNIYEKKDKAREFAALTPALTLVVRCCACLPVSCAVVFALVCFFLLQAKFPNPPKRLPTLLRFLQHKGLTPVDPADRAGLNPFLVPLVKVGNARERGGTGERTRGKMWRAKGRRG